MAAQSAECTSSKIMPAEGRQNVTYPFQEDGANSFIAGF
ncbi:hypothetical protein C725_0154 [Pacificimonas flava]|uniref:Uncharacterized protein n=1 Tax=Pacificimonas flava TaxID=1234595 RepID=M2TC62_9SPHN|nr:hypothetical protein C725_0154 [Pacificimonas flava]